MRFGPMFPAEIQDERCRISGGRIGMPAFPERSWFTRSMQGAIKMDVIMIGMGVVSFALFLAYTHACDAL